MKDFDSQNYDSDEAEESFEEREDKFGELRFDEPAETKEREIIEDPELGQKSSKIALYAILSIFIILGFIFSINYFRDTKFVEIFTPFGNVVRASDESYIFNGYEFTSIDGNWYTDVFNKQMSTIFNVGFQYDPDSVRDVKIQGRLSEKFLSSDVYYVTFNPNNENLKYTALASGELQLSMARAMRLPLKAACTENHIACVNVPLITCNNTDKPVFFIDEAGEEPQVIFDDNCVTITGKDENLVKAVDRLLFFWYGIMV